MIVINKKRIQIIASCLLIALFAFSFQIANENKQEDKNIKKTVETTSTPVSGKTVVLDAGHGVPDEGAQSSNGTTEAQTNLKITLKVQNLLEQSGCKVILTRSDENAIYDLDSKTLKQKKISDIHNRVKIGNESSADIFVSALKDAIAFSRKANEQIKGIVLWSHGSAWLPKSEILNSKRASTSSTRSFGIDITTEEPQEPYEMDIRELAERLRPFHYDFLVFDACFMSSIEVLYEMRNSFDYIISSPTEVLATGFPYKEILPELLSNSPNYSEIVEKYIAQYNEKKGVLKSASMTVVKTSVLKSFSESLKELINHDVTVPDISTILQYDQEATSWLFDIGGFVSLFKNSERKELVIKLLSDMILSYNHTDMFYGKIPLNGSSGISIYIPNNHKDRKYEHEFYKTLSWYKDISCDSCFWNNYNTGILQ